MPKIKSKKSSSPKADKAFERATRINLRQTYLFIRAFILGIDYRIVGNQIAERRSALEAYVKANLSADLIPITKQAPVDLSKLDAAMVEEYQWGQAYLILSVLSRILTNPRENFWKNRDDLHLRTILFDLRKSHGMGQDGHGVVEKLLGPIFESMNEPDASPYRLEVMAAIFRISGEVSFFDTVRFLGFVHQTVCADIDLSEGAVEFYSENVERRRPYLLGYREGGVAHRVAMGL